MSLGKSQLTAMQLHPVFIPTGHTHAHTHTLTQLQCLWSVTLMLSYAGYYILVYLQGHFLHCVNTRQQEMLCYSLFLSGKLFFWRKHTFESLINWAKVLPNWLDRRWRGPGPVLLPLRHCGAERGGGVCLLRAGPDQWEDPRRWGRPRVPAADSAVRCFLEVSLF